MFILLFQETPAVLFYCFRTSITGNNRKTGVNVVGLVNKF